MLVVQEARRAASRALAKTGKRIAARMAMIAMTTSSSMSVKAGRVRGEAFTCEKDGLILFLSVADALEPPGAVVVRRAARFRRFPADAVQVLSPVVGRGLEPVGVGVREGVVLADVVAPAGEHVSLLVGGSHRV